MSSAEPGAKNCRRSAYMQVVVAPLYSSCFWLTLRAGSLWYICRRKAAQGLQHCMSVCIGYTHGPQDAGSSCPEVIQGFWVRSHPCRICGQQLRSLAAVHDATQQAASILHQHPARTAAPANRSRLLIECRRATAHVSQQLNVPSPLCACMLSGGKNRILSDHYDLQASNPLQAAMGMHPTQTFTPQGPNSTTKYL